MRILIQVLRVILRASAVGVVLIGLALWSGRLSSFVSWHMILGGVVVLVAWIAAAISATKGVAVKRAIAIFLLGLVVLAIGVGQVRVLLNSMHWIVQTVHLMVGTVLVVLSEQLLRSIAEQTRNDTQLESGVSERTQ